MTRYAVADANSVNRLIGVSLAAYAWRAGGMRNRNVRVTHLRIWARGGIPPRHQQYGGCQEKAAAHPAITNHISCSICHDNPGLESEVKSKPVIDTCRNLLNHLVETAKKLGIERPSFYFIGSFWVPITFPCE